MTLEPNILYIPSEFLKYTLVVICSTNTKNTVALIL